MAVGVELAGLDNLHAMVTHAHGQLLDLTDNLEADLARQAGPMRAYVSPRLHARTWGPEKVWTLPAGGWVADSHGRVDLPDPTDTLDTYAQQLLG